MAVKIAHLYRGIWTSKRRCGWVIVFNRSSQSCFFLTQHVKFCAPNGKWKRRVLSQQNSGNKLNSHVTLFEQLIHTQVAHTFDCVIFKFSFLCGVVSMSLKAVGKISHKRGLKIFGWKHGVSMFPQHAQQVNSSCGVLLPAAVKFSLRRKNSIESILFKRV